MGFVAALALAAGCVAEFVSRPVMRCARCGQRKIDTVVTAKETTGRNLRELICINALQPSPGEH
jgi:hypothetical protein